MIIYHGSDKVIEKPVFCGGKRYNDYGFGFYCTKNKDMAFEWGVDRDRDGFCNEYSLDTEDLSILNLNDGSFTILHWLGILLQNRKFMVSSPLAREGREYIVKHFHVPYEEYDLIIGYRADDSYFSFANDFISGTISLSQLEKAMFLGELGTQIVLKSERSFEQIHYLSFDYADHNIWFPKKESRDIRARKEYEKTDKNGFVKGDLYMPMILNEEVKPDDARIQRIIS